MEFRGHNNGLKTAALFGIMWLLILGIGWVLSVSTNRSVFLWGSLLIGLGSTLFTYWNSARLALRSMDAYPVTREEAPRIYAIVEELSARAGQPMPSIWMAPTRTPNAFATGRNPKNAAVCVTEGIVDLLDERELRGVLGHELMHVYNRDILISSVAAALAGVMTSVAQFGLFGVGRDRRDNGAASVILSLLLVFLAPIASMIIQFAISRTREYDADEDGATLTQDPLALASALKKLQMGTAMVPMPRNQQTENVAAMMIANPFGPQGVKRLFSTHPPMEQRIARLERMAGY